MSTADDRRARRKHERREAILDAATSVFESKGATAATMDEVAEAAQVSKGTLYLYFPSKDDLFLALTHRPMDFLLARFEELEAGDLDGLGLLRALVMTHQQIVQAHGDKLRFAFASLCGSFEVDPDTPALREYDERVREVRRTYLGAIERGVADGSLRSELDPQEVGVALWAGMFGASFLRMNADRLARPHDAGLRARLPKVHETVAKFLLAAIAAPERAA